MAELDAGTVALILASLSLLIQVWKWSFGWTGREFSKMALLIMGHDDVIKQLLDRAGLTFMIVKDHVVLKEKV